MELNQMLTWALAEASPSGDANMDLIMRKVLRYKALEEGGRSISDFFGVGGDKMQDLNERNLKLEILMKKKQLGMDYNTSQDYENAINDGGADKAVAGTLSNKFNKVAEKHRFDAKNPQTLEALFKEAHAVGNDTGKGFGERRQPYFKTAYSAVSSEKPTQGLDLVNKFLGGNTHGSKSSLFRKLITRGR